VLAFLNESIKILQKLMNKRLELKWNNSYSANLNQLTNETTALIRPLHIPVSNSDMKQRRLLLLYYKYIFTIFF
jgi:hypothetical protein